MKLAQLEFTAWIVLASMSLWQFPAPAFAAEPADSVSSVEAYQPADSLPENRPDMPISPGFLIQLTSAQDQRLNGHFRIRPDGTVDLPYQVSLSTDGMTLARLQEAVIDRYQPLFRRAPRLDVSVLQEKFWVDVGGIVSRPGDYLVSEHSSLDELMSAAGGLTDDATNGYARILSGNGKVHWVDLDTYFKTGKADVPPWNGGEHVFFQLSGPDDGEADAALGEKKVRMIGEVKNPGEFLYKKGGDGYYYLAATGGPTTYSDLNDVELVRQDPKNGARHVSYEPISQITQVQPSDMMIVPPVRTSGGERTLTIATLVVGIVSASLLAFAAVRGSR